MLLPPVGELRLIAQVRRISHHGTAGIGLSAMDSRVGELSTRADVVCFGSLAQRSTASAATIESFLQNASAKAIPYI
jgi:hypothetical protein